MRTNLLTQLAQPRFLAAVILCGLVGVGAASAQDEATQIRFITGHYDCWGTRDTTEYEINGTVVATGVSLNNGCVCNQNPLVVTLNDPVTLAAINSTVGCDDFTFRHSDNGGGANINYVRAEITRPSGVEVVCVKDGLTGGCNDRNACTGADYGINRTFSGGAVDTDADGTPDECGDLDDDNDGVLDVDDSCPLVANPGQEDNDTNGVGDACQTVVQVTMGHYDCWGAFDTVDVSLNGILVKSGVSVLNACTCNDNPLVIDVSLAEVEAAGTLVDEPGCNVLSVTHNNPNGLAVNFVRGEIFHPDSSSETLCVKENTSIGGCEDVNACTGAQYGVNRTFEAALIDTDFDGDPDCTDPDDDNDGAFDTADNCPLVSNPDQTDTDNDGEGNACDLDDDDADNDGVIDAIDNCLDTPNTDQADSDGNGLGDACQPVVVAVPWAGNPASPHVVFDGGTIFLQASASKGGGGDPVSLVSGTWDPGDGSGPQAINVSNSRALELQHTYYGAPGQPFTATIEVEDGSGFTYSDTFKVQVQAKTLDVEVNMAIDKGLWNLHKKIQRGTSGGFSIGNWEQGSNIERDASATASVVQAFEINGHREIGDPLEDPYVDNVARGLRWLQDNVQRISIASQPAGDPDTNANGYGLDMGNDHPTYITGQIVDAFVASGTPGAVVVLGSETGRTYADLVQDLMDAYSWGQYEDGQGGWVYNWNSQGGIDSSASQWWAIGAHAADVWDTGFTPQWVRDEAWFKGIESLQRRHVEAAIPWTNFQGQFGGTPGTGSHGACSYRGGGGDHNHARTASCLVMMSAIGIGRDDPRFEAAEGYERRTFTTGDLHGNLYPMFALTKAMRLAKNAAGGSEPIDLLGGDLDWYRADPNPTNYADRNNGFARYLVGFQRADGHWDSNGWVSGDLSTAFAIIILSPTLFELSPIASCTADPIIDGTVALGGLVTFDGSGSSHQDPDYAGGLTYEWNFQDGGTATGLTVGHAFDNVGIYNVTLTVTDDGGLTNTTSCPVDVRNQDIPPNANIVITASDPICAGDTITLDGSTSYDLDSGIVSWEWDVTDPVIFDIVDLSGEVVQTSFATAGSYNIGLRVTDEDPNGANSNSEFTSVTVIPADDPSCNQPPVAVCEAQSVPADEFCQGSASVDGGSYDPDGADDIASIVETPAPPYSLGDTSVSLTITDQRGESDSCSATVSVVDVTPPTVACPATIELIAEAGCVHDTPQVWTAADDNCSVLSVDQSIAAGTSLGLGDHVVTVTATDGSGNVSAVCTTTVTVYDPDDDGVCGTDDVCADTVLPDGVPTAKHGVNRWALEPAGDPYDEDPFTFDTVGPNGSNRAYTTADTGGCSCEQIIEQCGYGKGHTKFGCSNSVMDWWTGLFDQAGQPEYQCH